MKRLLSFYFFLLISLSVLWGKEIKVLAIGNSFSVDAVENYLAELVAANGDTIIIGNMYIGGCSLERHYNNYKANLDSYSYRKIVNGVRDTIENYSLVKAFEDEEWDYVSFQQVSQNSGQYDTYFPYLDSLVIYAKKHIGKDVKIILHATWAYAKDAIHPGFANYEKDQTVMYNAIISTTQQVAKRIGAEFIVPSGTAIQNARTSSLGDTFCRDGYHLELTYGRYTAACTWFEKLFGISAIGSKYYPETITPFQAKIAQYAAHYACRNPYGVTSLNNRKK